MLTYTGGGIILGLNSFCTPHPHTKGAKNMKKFKLAGLQLLAALVLCLAVLPLVITLASVVLG
jgi:hypothetical protein